MKERIKKIMDYKSISAVDLAKITGVQRSNISHILNGRNKPGASFLENFLIAFPEINARWLLTGEGEMISFESKISEQTGEIEKDTKVKNEKKSKQVDIKRYADKVVLLFSDGTFDIYDNV